MSESQSAMQFKQHDAELWLVGRLRDHLCQIFNGLTHADIRRERIRRCIVNAELGEVVLGKHAGKLDTYATAFERLYGEPLTPKHKGKSHAESRPA